LIRYTSPSFSGLTVGIEKGFGETLTGNRDYAWDQNNDGTTNATTERAIDGSPSKQNEQMGIRVSYAAGPLGLGVAQETVTRFTGFNPDFLSSSGAATPAGDYAIGGTLLGANYENKRTARSVFATYDLGVAKIGLVSNDTEYKPTNAAFNKFDWSANTLSATVPLGALTVLASVGSGKIKVPGFTPLKASAYQLGADYALSKRTNGYALVGQTKWKDNDPVDGGKISYNTMSLGVRHQF
jgi:predicted porin